MASQVFSMRWYTDSFDSSGTEESTVQQDHVPLFYDATPLRNG